MKKRLLFVLLMALGSRMAFAAAGIWRTAFLVNWNGAFQWYYSGSNNPANNHILLNNSNFLGILPSSGNYFLLDPYFFSFENAGCNITAGRFYYRFYKVGSTPGAFNILTLSFAKDCADPNWRVDHNACSTSNGDEEWGNDVSPINFIMETEAVYMGLGDYKLDVYWQADVGNCGATTTLTTNTFTCTYTVSEPLFTDFAKFEAQRIGREVSLGWVTTNERDTENFEVLRSGDMRDWQTIQTITAKGGSTNAIAYQATDEKPLVGINYYRLRSNEYNGNAYYSSPIVQVRMSTEGRFMVAPNPAYDGRVNFYFSDHASEQILLRLFDAQGVLVRIWNMENIIKDEPYPVDVSQLPSGTYFIQIQGYASAIPIQIR